MKRSVHLIVVLLLLILSAVARADLAGDIHSVLEDKLLGKAQVSISIARLEADARHVRMLYRHDPDLPLAPASNLKLLTTSAALQKLGPDFKFRTLLVLHDGDLMLWGDGDPTMGDVEMLRKAGWDVDTIFKKWAEQLKKLKVVRIRDVVVDDSVFDTDFFPKTWPDNQLHKRYEAQVGGVNLNANCVDFYVRVTSPNQPVTYTTDPRTNYVDIKNSCLTGNRNAIWLSRYPGGNKIVLRGEADVSLDAPVSVTIDDPPMFAATVLKETLANAGIAITGQVKRDRTARADFRRAAPDQRRKWATVAVLQTPISTVLARANKDSMNLYAECLCKRLGHAVSGAPGSWENGTAAVGAFLQSIDVDSGEFHLVDGSGLSKENAVSSSALLKVLIYDYHSPYHQTFFSSLSVAGRDGTLEDRFSGSDLRGRVFAKSGYINGVSSLSGYFRGHDNEWYAFSILMNGIPPGSNSGIKLLQEKIVKAVDATTSPKAVAAKGR